MTQEQKNKAKADKRAAALRDNLRKRKALKKNQAQIKTTQTKEDNA